MAKDDGSSVKHDTQYEGLRKKGMSKPRGGDRQLRGLVEPRRQAVRLGLQEHEQREPGRHDPAEEGGRPQGRQGRGEQGVASVLTARERQRSEADTSRFAGRTGVKASV
jgi:hypothetical protein